MSRETHSLNKNHGECYFQMNSLIKNFFFSLKVSLGPGTAKKANTARLSKMKRVLENWGGVEEII